MRTERRQRRTAELARVLVIGVCVTLGGAAIPWGTGAIAAPVSAQPLTYHSTISSGSSGPLSLNAYLDYDDSSASAPIAVVMHGTRLGASAADVRANAQRLRDEGFFVVSVSMRGRDGSQGTPDYGGLEVYDIYDAVEAIKTQYANRVDASRVLIEGYSGGGGNVMSALTKFPDYFRGAAFFGMSDYGYNTTNGWYYNGGVDYRADFLNPGIGNLTTGNLAVKDRYLARASNMASKNNPYSEIHLFVNDNESICPSVNDTSYRDNAIAAASAPGEFNNIHVHIGNTAHPEYRDFNGNGMNDPSEKQYWPHGYPTADQQIAAEGWFLPRLLDGSIPQPQLNASDQLFVAGFVKTKPFTLWLGDGQNAAAALDYSLSAGSKTFALDVLSSDRSVTGWIEVNTQDMAGHQVEVLLDGMHVGQVAGGGLYRYNNLGDAQTLTLRALPEPGALALVVSALLGLSAYAWSKRRWTNVRRNRDVFPGLQEG